MKILRRIEVTAVETGKTRVMTHQQFFKTFGKREGKEILAGYAPNVVAVAVAYDADDTSRVATDCDPIEGVL